MTIVFSPRGLEALVGKRKVPFSVRQMQVFFVVFGITLLGITLLGMRYAQIVRTVQVKYRILFFTVLVISDTPETNDTIQGLASCHGVHG